MNSRLDNRLLVTGSEGLIGGIIVPYLQSKGYQFLTRLDKNNPGNPVDILTDDISSYFKDVDTVIHLAANSNPFINEEDSLKNIEIAKRVIKACETSGCIKRIINASSINVYPYIDIFESGGKITERTPLSQNMRFGNGEYGRAKIEVERLFEEYARAQNISLLNLRLGCVTKNNLLSRQKEGHIESVDYEIHLTHEDLVKIIEQGLRHKGIASYVCVSKRDGFVDESINFPIEQ